MFPGMNLIECIRTSEERPGDLRHRVILNIMQNNTEMYHVTFWQYRRGDVKDEQWPLNPEDRHMEGHSHLRDPYIFADPNINNNESVIGFSWFLNFDGQRLFFSFDIFPKLSNVDLITNPFVSTIINTLQSVISMQDLDCKTLTINDPENRGRRRFIISVLVSYLRDNNMNVQNPNFQTFINRCVNLKNDDFPDDLRN